jgi:pimeloyl-ACP methyl ester carboxylesterase
MREARRGLGGFRTRIVEAGPPDEAQAALFIHGNPGSSEDWDALVEQSGETGRAIAFDLPGWGRAEKPRGFPYDIDGYANYIGRALDELGVKKVHLVLHDYGGFFGLRWAANHPESVASVVLINTPGVPIGYNWYLVANLWRTPVVGELFMLSTIWPTYKVLIGRGNPKGLPDAALKRMYRDLDRATRRTILKLYRSTPNPAALAPALKSILQPLSLPALVIWGDHDPYIPLAMVQRQRQVFDDLEVVHLPDSGHWPFLDDPVGVEQALVPFLRRVWRREP